MREPMTIVSVSMPVSLRQTLEALAKRDYMSLAGKIKQLTAIGMEVEGKRG